MRSSKLAIQTVIAMIAGVMTLAAALLLPAWTLDYWQAWVFIVVFVGCIAAIGTYLALNDPALLQRRFKGGGPTAEERPAQRAIIALLRLSFLGVLVLSALDHRFDWSRVSPLVSGFGDLLVVLGMLNCLRVFRANTYAASTIEVAVGQTVISSGPYRIVRHPMYSAVLIILLGTPLALGSWWGLLAAVVSAGALIWRILDEEKLLKKDLPGYTQYAQGVRYRLVPFVW